MDRPFLARTTQKFLKQRAKASTHELGEKGTLQGGVGVHKTKTEPKFGLGGGQDRRRHVWAESAALQVVFAGVSY